MVNPQTVKRGRSNTWNVFAKNTGDESNSFHKISYNNQLDALISQIYFRNETLHVSDSSSVHHQEFFTVHTAMVYVIQVCI